MNEDQDDAKVSRMRTLTHALSGSSSDLLTTQYERADNWQQPRVFDTICSPSIAIYHGFSAGSLGRSVWLETRRVWLVRDDAQRVFEL